MPTDLRISPAIRFEIEQFVERICRAAKLDIDERLPMSVELRGHLEERFGEAVDPDGMNLADQAALNRVLATFGSVEQVAKSIRRPALYRWLFHKQHKLARIFWLSIPLVIIGAFFGEEGIRDEVHAQLGRVVISPAPRRYPIAAALVLLCALLMRWKPKPSTRVISVLAASRFLLLPLVFPLYGDLMQGVSISIAQDLLSASHRVGLGSLIALGFDLILVVSTCFWPFLLLVEVAPVQLSEGFKKFLLKKWQS
jgi:hypothetical protein